MVPSFVGVPGHEREDDLHVAVTAGVRRLEGFDVEAWDLHGPISKAGRMLESRRPKEDYEPCAGVFD